jgi:S-ribosylhomocysteine lyase
MQPKTQVDSFELDHTKVRAPYVRLADTKVGPHGDRVVKWDVRLVQPNQAEIPTAPLHTIEHLLAGYLRDALDGEPVDVVDASPMGCRTGFYVTMLGELAPERLLSGVEEALAAISKHDGPIPGCAPERCGNWRDHSLPGANAWAADILDQGFIVQETVPLP